MMKKTVLLLGLMLLLACNPAGVKKSTPLLPKFPEVRTVTVNKENIREEPNGYVIGELHKGEKVTVLRKMGNWIEYQYYPDEKGYVWAPSLGYEYINLYSPATYIDTTAGKFYSLNYLNSLFGQQPDTLDKTGAIMHLEYKDLGLGKRVEEIMEVATVKKVTVEKTVKVWYNARDKTITEVQSDLFKPVKGVKAALKRAGVTGKVQTVENNDSRVVIKLPYKKRPFYLILKRKEWGSDHFIGYVITGKI